MARCQTDDPDAHRGLLLSASGPHAGRTMSAVSKKGSPVRNIGYLMMLFLLLPNVGVACSGTSPISPAEIDVIRMTERERLHALVDGDMKVARRLHADDFRLITPDGLMLTKEQYLGALTSGILDYLYWEPDSPIDVRFYGDEAVIRYRSQLENIVRGHHEPRRAYWHMDVYEKRCGVWQVVWSQATEIQ